MGKKFQVEVCFSKENDFDFEKRNCPVIIGLDIHDPKLFLTDLYIDRALSVCEGLDINFLWDYDLVSAAKKRKQLFK